MTALIARLVGLLGGLAAVVFLASALVADNGRQFFSQGLRIDELGRE